MNKTYTIKEPEFKHILGNYRVDTPSLSIDIFLSMVDLETYRVYFGTELISSKLTLNEAKNLAKEIYYREIEQYLVELGNEP